MNFVFWPWPQSVNRLIKPIYMVYIVYVRGKHCHHTIILIKADFMHRDGAYSHSVFTKLEMCTYHSSEILSVLIIVCIMRNNHSLLLCPLPVHRMSPQVLPAPLVFFLVSLSSFHFTESWLQAGCMAALGFCWLFTGGKHRMDREFCNFEYLSGIWLGARVSSSLFF